MRKLIVLAVLVVPAPVCAQETKGSVGSMQNPTLMEGATKGTLNAISQQNIASDTKGTLNAISQQNNASDTKGTRPNMDKSTEAGASTEGSVGGVGSQSTAAGGDWRGNGGSMQNPSSSAGQYGGNEGN